MSAYKGHKNLVVSNARLRGSRSAPGRMLLALIVACVAVAGGWLPTAFADGVSSQSVKKEFVAEMKSEYKRANKLYGAENKNPYVYKNKHSNGVCISGYPGTYASDYLVAKSYGEEFFQSHLRELLTIRDFVANCAPGAIIELPADDDYSIARFCNFRDVILHMRGAVGREVLCVRQGEASSQHR